MIGHISLFLLCLTFSMENQLAKSYYLQRSSTRNGPILKGNSIAQIKSETKRQAGCNDVMTVRMAFFRKLLPTALLTGVMFGLSDMTYSAPVHAAVLAKKEELKVVSAYVPGLPSETSLSPELIPETQSNIPVVLEAISKQVPVVAAEIAPKVVVPQLTAREILLASVEPKIAQLKDILFTFKLYPSYLDSRDYVSFRAGLRQQPAMDLRKTCKILKPFLPSEKQTKFQESYAVMIDAVNDMDVLALKRVQGTGVPDKGLKDEVMQTLLTNAILKLENLVDIVSTTTF